jgi:hypothetical protein
VPTFADGGSYVVNVKDPYGRIHGFLDRKQCSQANKIETKLSITSKKNLDIMLILGIDNITKCPITEVSIS